MYIRVTVTPNAKKESFKETAENRFSCSVREKAERNMANGRVVELVASHFRVPVGKVRIISGHRSSRKLVSVNMDE